MSIVVFPSVASAWLSASGQKQYSAGIICPQGHKQFCLRMWQESQGAYGTADKTFLTYLTSIVRCKSDMMERSGGVLLSCEETGA